jgi:hypothetical protein
MRVEIHDQIRAGILLATVVITILAGCSTSPSSHSVIFSGTIEAEEEQFVMDGNISLSIGATPDATFEEVTVALYDENKEEIRRVNVGELATNRPPHEQRINITTDQIPEYVVIESSDFWQSDTTVYVNGYKRPGDEGRYEDYSRANADEKFPHEETESS